MQSVTEPLSWVPPIVSTPVPDALKPLSEKNKVRYPAAMELAEKARSMCGLVTPPTAGFVKPLSTLIFHNPMEPIQVTTPGSGFESPTPLSRTVMVVVPSNMVSVGTAYTDPAEITADTARIVFSIFFIVFPYGLTYFAPEYKHTGCQLEDVICKSFFISTLKCTISRNMRSAPLRKRKDFRRSILGKSSKFLFVNRIQADLPELAIPTL